MGERLFQDCRSLRVISIPPQVETMTGWTFADSPAMSIEISKANSIFRFYASFIVNDSLHMLVRYLGSEKHVLIEKHFCGIGPACFRTNVDAVTVEFEAGSQISFLGVSAFFSCDGLESLSIPSTVENISDHCFGCCAKLTTVTFESSSRLSFIGDYAFSDCWLLESISIPASVTTIGRQCFSYCRRLRTVTLELNSRLSAIGVYAFFLCSPSLRLPSWLDYRSTGQSHLGVHQ
jgi:hypothetical protein